MKKLSAKNMTRLSLLCAISICLSAVESFLPVISAVPGGKLGLANVVILIIIYEFDPYSAVFVNILRAVLSSLMFSGANAFLYSVCGAVLSSAAMLGLYKLPKDKISPIGISVAGAFMHNLGQVLVSSLMLKNTAVISYICPLSVISVVSGCVTGYGALYFIKHKTTGDFYE